MPPLRRLAAPALIAYGAPSLPMAALTLPLYIHLPTYYAVQIGLDVVLVGLLLLFARLLDVVADPFIGLWSDRTRSRFGRRRPWILGGTPLVLGGVWFLFNPDAGVGGFYLLFWSAMLYIGWAMVMLPTYAWGAELSTDYHERSRIVAYREGFLIFGSVVALGLPVVLQLLLEGPIPNSLTLISWVVMIALPPAIAAMMLFTPEPRVLKQERVGFREGIRLIAKNPAFRRIIAAYLLNGIANGLPATMFLLFSTHVIGAGDQADILLCAYFLSGIFSVPLWLGLSYRFGKHRVWCGAMIWACAVFVFAIFLGPGDFWLFAVIVVLTGTALGADLLLPPSMQGDVVELDFAELGEQRGGLFFAVWGMATKMALALAVGIAFPILAIFGFEQEPLAVATQMGATVTQPELALWALAALFGVAPIAFKIGAVMLIWNFPIDAKKQAEIRRRIEDKVAL